MISWKLLYNDEMVKQIFLGAIYHDIGMALLPADIMNKSSSLTIEEKMMVLHHPTKGHEFVKQKTYLSAYIKQIVLRHHECIDGSGYPNRLVGKEVSKISQIVGIADIYDAMTSDRPYKKAVSPSEALEFIVANSGKFDEDVIRAIVQYIVPYPKGSLVELSSGQIAVVDSTYSDFPLRPKIRIIEKVNDEYTYSTIDMRKQFNLTIRKLSYDFV